MDGEVDFDVELFRGNLNRSNTTLATRGHNSLYSYKYIESECFQKSAS